MKPCREASISLSIRIYSCTIVVVFSVRADIIDVSSSRVRGDERPGAATGKGDGVRHEYTDKLAHTRELYAPTGPCRLSGGRIRERERTWTPRFIEKTNGSWSSLNSATIARPRTSHMASAARTTHFISGDRWHNVEMVDYSPDRRAELPMS